MKVKEKEKRKREVVDLIDHEKL
jgi:DNA repair exonuclease SbcCD ATPase subunit